MHSQVDKGNIGLYGLSFAYIFQYVEFELFSQIIIIPVVTELECDIIDVFFHQN